MDETLEALRRATPTRNLVRRKCHDCGREWVQPSPRGRCPVCHGENVVNLDERVCVLPRV